ncbi:MAG: hypothetical protein OXU51_01070, partial [Candidatus Poribacteria bacterium]|nr:hypothetical protein [Candidatus Poribacteria bacterium]
TESKSASTQSRRCITVSVDDSNLPRDAETMAYCSRYYSKAHTAPIWCQNILGITLKCGAHVLPLDMRLVSKQGRGNTDKPTLVITMLKEVLAFFDTHGIDLRKYPIPFDSWYAGRKMDKGIRQSVIASLIYLAILLSPVLDTRIHLARTAFISLSDICTMYAVKPLMPTESNKRSPISLTKST